MLDIDGMTTDEIIESLTGEFAEVFNIDPEVTTKVTEEIKPKVKAAIAS